VIDSYTDSRVTDAQIAAVKKNEEKNGLKDGKPIEKPDDHRDEPGKNNPTKDEPQNNKPDDTPAYVKEMLDTLKGLNAPHPYRRSDIVSMLQLFHKLFA
jgi:hypothetical protein